MFLRCHVTWPWVFHILCLTCPTYIPILIILRLPVIKLWITYWIWSHFHYLTTAQMKVTGFQPSTMCTAMWCGKKFWGKYKCKWLSLEQKNVKCIVLKLQVQSKAKNELSSEFMRLQIRFQNQISQISMNTIIILDLLFYSSFYNIG